MLKNLFLWPIHAQGIIPPIHDRHIVYGLGMASKMDGETAIFIWPGCPVVHDVDLLVIGFDKALFVIHGDGPESINRYFFEGKKAWRSPIVFLRVDNLVQSRFGRVAAPTRSCTDRVEWFLPRAYRRIAVSISFI